MSARDCRAATHLGLLPGQRKVASQEAKPDGLLLVPPDRELQFLHPLPVRRLWGVGARTEEKLRTHGVETVAQVAELGESALTSMVGAAMGRQLYCLAHNIDRRRVLVRGGVDAGWEVPMLPD